jgi:hypothetical protein
VGIATLNEETDRFFPTSFLCPIHGKGKGNKGQFFLTNA